MKLNLGSGQRKFGTPDAPWINVDSQAKWEPDVVADGLEYLKSLPGDSVETICLHHCAEHMTLSESKEVFSECHRVLQPSSGSLIVCVPDLNELTRAWISGKIDDYIFCVNLHGAYMGDDADIHKWSFTKKSLTWHLIQSGRWEWIRPLERNLPGADIAKDWWILSLEAIKRA